MFGGTPLLEHLVLNDQIFVNATDKNDPEMRAIKKAIIDLAKKQPTWGEKVPKCFIPLELEFSNLVKKNIDLITMEDMQKINQEQPIRPLTDPELKVFLKFQHAIGKIIYFDEDKLGSHIILSPTHLIDAFKSIVTDKMHCAGDRKREEVWDVMSRRGVISKQAIDEIWKKRKYSKFNKNKEYLLGVMSHLDILTEPNRYDSSQNRIPADFYYIASMVRTQDTTLYLQSPRFSHRNIALAFHLGNFAIPPALAFRFISYCLSIWGVKTYGDQNEEMLFHRSAVFTIDSSLDMRVDSEDKCIVVRLVHARDGKLIIRDLASSMHECLEVALQKISQLYLKTSSQEVELSDGNFSVTVACGSALDPCFLSIDELNHIASTWLCPSHGIEHGKHMLTSWFSTKVRSILIFSEPANQCNQFS